MTVRREYTSCTESQEGVHKLYRVSLTFDIVLATSVLLSSSACSETLSAASCADLAICSGVSAHPIPSLVPVTSLTQPDL